MRASARKCFVGQGVDHNSQGLSVALGDRSKMPNRENATPTHLLTAAREDWSKLLVSPLDRTPEKVHGRLLVAVPDNSDAHFRYSSHPSKTTDRIEHLPAICPLSTSEILGVPRIASTADKEHEATVACLGYLDSTGLALNPNYKARCDERRISAESAKETINEQAARFCDLTKLFSLPGHYPGQENQAQLVKHYKRNAAVIDFFRERLPIQLPHSSEVFASPFTQTPTGYLQGCLRFSISSPFTFTWDNKSQSCHTELSCIVRMHTKVADNLDGVELQALFEFGMVLPGKQAVTDEFKRTTRKFVLLGDFIKVAQTNEISNNTEGSPRRERLTHIGLDAKARNLIARFNVEHLKIRIASSDPTPPAQSSKALTLVGHGLKKLLHERKAEGGDVTALSADLLPLMHHPVCVTPEELSALTKNLD